MPVIANLREMGELQLTKPVTFIVGENGLMGKVNVEIVEEVFCWLMEQPIGTEISLREQNGGLLC